MTYLKQFEEKITKNDYQGFLTIWEEYCYSEKINYDELKNILILTKKSDLAENFGQHVNRAILLWEQLKDIEEKHDILKLIVDIQNKNDEELAEIVFQHLKSKYHDDPLFNEKIRLVGLRSKENFQGAISKYDLLNHIKKGKFVFHTAGWGTGEILDVSLLREEIILEFEYVIGQKNLSFENALKTLVPLEDEHFLARRFGNPDLLEKQAKDSPVEIIKLLLKDLGPQQASDIKEALCDLVIPSKDWNKWWQNARTKIKKDKKIEMPEAINEPFKLRETEIEYELILQEQLENKPKPKEIIQMVHGFLKDYPDTIKNKNFKKNLITKLLDVISFEDLSDPQKIQIHFFLEFLKVDESVIKIKEIIENITNFYEFIEEIDITMFKKKVLIGVKTYKDDWENIFLNIIFKINQNVLRDYLFYELHQAKSSKLNAAVQELLMHPLIYPTSFVWYFQKIFFEKEEGIPFSDTQGKLSFFEGFLILLDHLENKPQMKDYAKKMIRMLSSNKYGIVKSVMEMTTIDQAKEYLLLASKCRLLDNHDIQIIHSFAKITHPNLEDIKHQKEITDIIFSTQKGYENLLKKLNHISSVEIIANAKEIEEARSHGDLRENAEYKAALEKRDRLQSEIKSLSEQLNKIKILTKNDISTDKVCVGTIVDCVNVKGEKKSFTILGPFDSNSEKNILSFQSKLAKDMLGKAIGEKFHFKDKELTIVDIRNYFD